MKRLGWGRVLLAVMLLGGLVPRAAACQADPFALVQDDFSRPNAHWEPDGDHVRLADGHLALKPELNSGWRLPISRFKLLGGTYCAELKSPAGPSDTEAGIMFWMVDAANLFIATISPDGTFEIDRKKDNAWQTLLKRAAPKFKAGPGAVNEIKVITKRVVDVSGLGDSRYQLTPNSILAVYVNGQFITNMELLAPKDGGSFGLWAQSGSSQRAEWQVLSFSATPLPLEPHGVYKVIGSSGGLSYEGKVTVEEAGDAYAVVLSIGGKSIKGTGVLRGATFAVAYGDAGQTEIASYTPVRTDGPDPSCAACSRSLPEFVDWIGKRASSGTRGPVASETWFRQPWP